MAATAKQLDWNDAHFCGLRSQTNVYGLSKIISKDGLPKFLAVSVNGHFISVEYQKSFDNRLIPITREDVFFSTNAYPGETEIVSVDVICMDDGTKGNILAISYLKLEGHYEEKPTAFMNIYFLPAREADRPYPNVMEAISQSQLQYLNLDFVPFKLMHQSILLDGGGSEMCFLLSGSDNKIHVYREIKEGNKFIEDTDAVEKYFPEFANIEGCVTQMEFRRLDDTHRLSVIGIQSGLVSLSLVDTQTKEIIANWNTDMDSPITSLQLFTQHTDAGCPDFLETTDEGQTERANREAQPINLLVTSAIDPAAVFCDVVSHGFSKCHVLPVSNSQDVVLCSCVIDIDFDGENEIVIGTYGQVLLAYKFVYEKPASMLMTSTPFQSPMPVGLPVSGQDTPTSEDRLPYEQEKSDRRRHKSVAAVLDSSDSSRHDKSDRNRSDEGFPLESSLKDGQMARLVKSQENLASLSPRSVCFNTPDNQVTSDLTFPSNAFMDLTDYPCYRLTWTKRFADPVMGLTCGDVMGDGMMNLVVLTLKGLHVLQPDLNDVAMLVLERLKLICDPASETDDDYHQLQTETLGEE